MSSAEKLGQAWQHHQAGQFNRAERLYQDVLVAEPEQPDALHMLGILTHQTGNPEAGAELVKRAIKKRPEDAHMHANLAMILEAQGKLPEAIHHNEQAIKLRPEHTGARLNLANQQRASGDIEAAIESYRALLALNPQDAGAWSNLGSALRACGRAEEATEAYEKARALLPENAEILSNLANALQEQGRYDEAIKAFNEAIRLAPDFADAYANLGIAHLQAGKPEAALTALVACREHDPVSRTALAFETVARYQTGDTAGARAITDLERSIRATAPKEVRGFESVARFNQALAEHVEAHPSVRYEPFSKTTRRGRQSGNLLHGTRGPVARLEQIINQAIREYLAASPFASGHPYLLHDIQRWDLNIWATLLDDQGHQASHIHPGGWLSGVYYVSVPGHETATDNSGWIEFGPPPDEIPGGDAVASRLIEPQAGTLLVFPSYFFHRTVPFKGPETRISIAFDMIPLA